MSNIVFSLAAEIADIGSHVYRGDSQPRLASGHPAARVVSRGWQGQEAHPGQPVLLGPGGDRRPEGFRTLPRNLASVAYNIAHTSLNPNAKIVITTRPTPLQDKAFKLLGVNL